MYLHHQSLHCQQITQLTNQLEVYLNFFIFTLRKTKKTCFSFTSSDDSSDGEKNWRGNNQSSCDTLDKSGTLDGSLSSLGSKKLKGAKKAVRQAQLKR